jgi:hypothetical protein
MIRAQLHSRPLICAIAVAVSLTALHIVPASPPRGRKSRVMPAPISRLQNRQSAGAPGPNRRCRIAMIMLGEPP